MSCGVSNFMVNIAPVNNKMELEGLYMHRTHITLFHLGVRSAALIQHTTQRKVSLQRNSTITVT